MKLVFDVLTGLLSVNLINKEAAGLKLFFIIDIFASAY